MTPNPRYGFWRSCLAAKDAKKPIPAAVVDQPECGFWRLKRHGSWIPVAVWPNGGDVGVKIGTEVVGWHVGIEQWPRYCANPITEAVYRAIERGEPWPDADPVVSQMLETGRVAKSVDAAGSKSVDPVGSNPTPATIDTTAEFREQIATAMTGVPAYRKIESDEADVRALSLRNLLNELALNADKSRESEKRPHLDAIKEIDGRWQPLIKEARGAAGEVKEARDEWADQKRRAAIAAAQRQREAEDEAMVAGKPAPLVAPSNLPLPTTTTKPAYGRASPTGTKMIVTEVDYDKMFAALKLRPEWQDFANGMREIAQKLMNRGIKLDGVVAEERSNTR